MRRLLQAKIRAPAALRRWVGPCLLIALLLGHAGLAQTDTSGEYRIYPLQHVRAAEVEKVLGQLLAGLGDGTHLVADAKANQLLLRGPEEAQRIARELTASYDRPTTPPQAGKPTVKAYACDRTRLSDVATTLRAMYSERPGIRVAVDPNAARIIVLAPPEVHAAIPQQLAALVSGAPTRGLPPGAPAGPPAQARPSEQFVPLVRLRTEQIEGTLRKLMGGRLRPVANPGPGRPHYELVDAAGQSLGVEVDRRRNGFMLWGASPLVRQLARLIHSLDDTAAAAGRTIRVLPVRRADPGKVQEAIRAFRQGHQGSGRQGPSGKPPTAVPAAQHQSAIDHGSSRTRQPDEPIRLVNYELFQQSPEGAAPTQPGAAADEELRQRIRELGADVEVEILPDLDVIILRGRDQDVKELTRIIEEIERLSAETQPAIEIVPLKHVRGDVMTSVIDQVSMDLIGGRQGRVSVTPLVKPNALLLIGWGDAVGAIKELIAKLDRPVPPETQLRVFRLKHAMATRTRVTVEQFLGARTGLGPKVQVVADVRTNTLVVQAGPRDMAEVALLVERLDAGASGVVNRARVFRLKNSLAADVGGTLQRAIDAARGGTADRKSAVLELLTIDAEAEKVLKSGDLSDAQITADPRTNTLLVTAPPESMELLAALIEHLDSPASTAQIKVFRIVNGDANALILMLRTLVPSQTGAQTRPQLAGAEGETSLVPLRFSVDARTNSIIATGSTGDLKIIEALLLRLDAKDVQQRKNTVYRLRNAPALDVAKAINDFLRSERQVQQAAPGTISPFQQIEREVVVVPEPVSNSLILSATPRFFTDIMDLVEQLDEEPPKVMIQVLIAEVALGDAHEFGVELGLQDSLLFDRSLIGNLVTTTSSTQRSTPAGIITDTQESIVSASNTPGFTFNSQELPNSASDRALRGSDIVGGQGLSNFAVGRINNELGFGGMVLSASSESVSVLIRSLQETRRLEVLSRPQIMTLDNQPAFIQVGQRVPRIVGTTINLTGQVNNITLENVGLILGVTPRISPDDMVVMEIDAEKSQLGPEAEGIPVAVSEGVTIRSPRIDLTTAQTTVSAASGETIVLGGLITKRESAIHRSVPWISDIPVLGNLFRYDSETCRRTELLIILTPHVVRSAEEAARIKQAEATRMHWCLSDVTELHGPTGIRPRDDGMIYHDAAPVVYPDMNPRGVVPQGIPPSGDGATPSAEEIPPPAGLGPMRPPHGAGVQPPKHGGQPLTPRSAPQRFILPGAMGSLPPDWSVAPAAYTGPVYPGGVQAAVHQTPLAPPTRLLPYDSRKHGALWSPGQLLERLPDPRSVY